jgi:hypothetical protein
MMRAAVIVLLAALSLRLAEVAPPRAAPSSSPSSVSAATSASAGSPSASSAYGWLDDPGTPPRASDDLARRFPPPPGFRRVELATDGFGAFLRNLPLAPKGTPLVDFAGRRLRDDGFDPHVAAIVAIDVGDHDLQQCADSIVRMHAEWRWSVGDRAVSYRAGNGTALSYARYREGFRAQADGAALRLVQTAKPALDQHGTYRAWLDEVFAWVNTGALARDAQRVAFESIAPGDFMVMPGAPFGHAVLVLDVARDDAGRTALLLGQGFMPAQRFQVLGPLTGEAWFVVDARSRVIETPFWRPFPFDSLRRFATHGT